MCIELSKRGIQNYHQWLAISITSEDLDHRTVYHSETATDNLLSKKPLLNLTHIDDEVSFVDE